ncbi:MAG: uridine diphosphate-N-acetylglucosamine-binding protein YvcK [Candidatus Nealsonbacteria bacterium]
MSKKTKKVVCFAGGSVAPKIILKPLKDLGFDMVGITSMVDNGGSTGVLRKEFNALPPGDIRRHLLALSEAEDWKKKLWDFRFGKDAEMSFGHYGHNFANVFIVGLENIFGSFEKALEISHQFLNVKGKALPATIDKVQLKAELEDGTIVDGEDDIDTCQKHDPNLKIKRIYLEPDGKAYLPAIEEIKSADFLIFGPGDLYSSILPCLLLKGIKEAVKDSLAKKIFICPLMTKKGETLNFLINDFCKEVEKYLGSSLDVVIYNNNYPSEERVEEYKKEAVLLGELIKAEEGLNSGKFIGENLILDNGKINHDEKKLIPLLEKIINN